MIENINFSKTIFYENFNVNFWGFLRPCFKMRNIFSGVNSQSDAMEASIQPRDMFAFMSNESQTPFPKNNGGVSYRKTKWLPEEDELLLKSVQINGTKNWTAVSVLVPGRNAKQCRERYTGQLDPNLNHNEWTNQEDFTLIHMHGIYGNAWAKISAYLPGRSPTAVKNRCNLLKKRNNMQHISNIRRLNIYNSEPSLQDSSMSFSLSSAACSDIEGSQSQEQLSEANDEPIFKEIFDNDDANDYWDPLL